MKYCCAPGIGRILLTSFLGSALIPALLPAADVSPELPAFESMTLEQLAEVKVVSAALHAQSLAEAPASVTVVTAADIRKYGYRTLAEALDGVRGLYVSTDRTYSYLGVRGLSIPGDYGSRYLLLINGHSMADPIYYGSGYLEQDLPIELNLVKQIEIVHGPASALYGSNAVSCTINVVTKHSSDIPEWMVIADSGTQGENKINLSYAAGWKGVHALVSGSVFNYGGEDSIYIPGYDVADTNFGRAVNMDGQRGYHFFSDLAWRNWTFTMMSGSREKIVPVTQGDTIFNDRGNRVIDAVGFAEAAYTRKWKRLELDWRVSYDRYYYWGLSRYQLDNGAVEDNREHDQADWIGSRQTWTFNAGRVGTITAGAEWQIELRNLQSNFDLQPVQASLANVSKTDRHTGLFLQEELALSKNWKTVLGVRLDTSDYRRDSLSPRASLIWSPSHRTALKFLYGASFRDPSTYEMFFADGLTSSANPSLAPERGDTLEMVAEKQSGHGLKLSASVYRTNLRNLIVAGRDSEGFIQFMNAGSDRLTGGDGALSGRIRNLEFAASLAIQSAYDAATRVTLENSPRQIAKLRFAVPLLRNHLTAAASLNWLSRRSDTRGDTVSSAMKTDITFTTRNLGRGFDLQFGARNLFDRRIYDIAELNELATVMPRPGRSMFLRLSWQRDD